MIVSFKRGNDTTGDGSYEEPFATLARALEVADDGEIITIEPSFDVVEADITWIFDAPQAPA